MTLSMVRKFPVVLTILLALVLVVSTATPVLATHIGDHEITETPGTTTPDLTAVDPHTIKDISVELTMVGGEVVYEA